jgi:hypothetical protein
MKKPSMPSVRFRAIGIIHNPFGAAPVRGNSLAPGPTLQGTASFRKIHSRRTFEGGRQNCLRSGVHDLAIGLLCLGLFSAHFLENFVIERPDRQVAQRQPRRRLHVRQRAVQFANVAAAHLQQVFVGLRKFADRILQGMASGSVRCDSPGRGRSAFHR